MVARDQVVLFHHYFEFELNLMTVLLVVAAAQIQVNT